MVGLGARAACSGRSARVEMVGQACSGSADLQVGVQHLVFGPPEPASAGDSFLVDLFNIQRARISPHFFQARRPRLSAKPSNTLQWKSAALPALPQQVFPRRDGRVAEGARLESVCTRKGTQGSNPCLSAIPLESPAQSNYLQNSASCCLSTRTSFCKPATASSNRLMRSWSAAVLNGATIRGNDNSPASTSPESRCA